jgi:prolyl-tRNA synthetase
LLMPTIQSADLWRESGRYDAYGKEMLRIKDRHERDMLYGPTNEEMITEMFRAYVRSYKDVPLNLYHIQWKFRDEVRPRFGLMRGREFLMKDAYSFDIDQAGARHSYNKMFVAYLRTFARLGLKSIPMRADTGPIGGDLSHEFIILAETGESEVFCHKDYLDFAVPDADVDFDDIAGLQSIVDKWTSLYAATSEKHDAAAFGKLPSDKQVSARGIEVGHIFYFGTKYSEPMKAVVMGPDGVEHPVHMGSYGIGPSRLVAAVIEASHDEAGIIWPERIAPYRAIILNLKQGAAETDGACEQLYRALTTKGVETLYHDLDERPGAKFAIADLVGVPWQILVGPRSLAEGKVELKRRADGSKELMTVAAAIDRVSQ